MNETAWKVLSRTPVFRGGPINEIAVESVRLPDGRVIDDYYSIRLADCVLVYPEMVDGSIRMFRQYKHGLGRVCLGFPGGAIEPGETPVAAARRELLEELGCEAAEWHAVGAFATNGNQGCNKAHLFRASGCRVIGPPTAPDMERPSVEALEPAMLLQRDDVFEQIGLASHALLLLIATRI